MFKFVHLNNVDIKYNKNQAALSYFQQKGSMNMKYYIVSFFVSMLAITNPFGNLAIFIGLTSNRTDNEKRRIAITVCISVAVVLTLTVWTGDYILKIFGVSLASFQVAGGLIITLIGLSMMRSEKSSVLHTKEESKLSQTRESIAVVPLTIPIIAGPGAIATVIMMVKDHASFWDRLRYSGASLGIALIVGIMLYFSPFFARLLGEPGLKIATRIMGMVLVSIAISMAAKGLGGLFPALINTSH